MVEVAVDIAKDTVRYRLEVSGTGRGPPYGSWSEGSGLAFPRTHRVEADRPADPIGHHQTL